MKILIADSIHPSALAMLREKAELVDAVGASEEELMEKISDVDAVMLRSKPKLTSDVLRHAKRLKVIGRAGVGVDNIDVDYATKKGVIVVNAPEASTTTVAEHTFGMILSLARKIPPAVASLKSGRWEKKRFMGVELKGKTLGIIGFGRIGSRVAELGKAFGMKVVAYDPYISVEAARKKGVELVELEELLKVSDIITLHIPRTEKTIGLIGRKELEMMKSTAFLVNCARGGVVDEDALLHALKDGWIGGAALDVFEREPPLGSALLELENLIATPHLGASTAEAQESASMSTARDVLAVLENRTPKNAVNMPAFGPEAMERLSPYLHLCELLGRFCIQLVEGRVREVSVIYCGELMDVEELSLLTSTVLKGLLAPILLNTINVVNAEIVARERGIKVVQGTSEDAEEYPAMVVLRVKSDIEAIELKGVLFAGLHPRIVGVDGYAMDIAPEGRILIIRNEDRPGIIGRIATTLGRHSINIGSMHVGRKRIGGTQIMAVSIDQDISEETLTSLSLIDGVLSVRAVRL